MESYIITYDLKYSSNNYDDLIDKIKNYPKWAHVNESVWIVKSNTRVWRNVIDSNSAIKECF